MTSGTAYTDDTYGSGRSGGRTGYGTRSQDNYGSAKDDSYGGNQTSSFGKSNDDSYAGTGSTRSSGNDDSKIGRFMEKAGNALNSDKLASKGREKRDEAGSGGYGGSNDY